mmetsp:Transcript_3855/g.4514  ORF Transcript_3855/g.4514 Transcript_3855/m.4514 type:complete len:122 (-) Transcript_3855:174-539(-)|eukprot:CAMPEP_0204831390 /NCGR_PEP_ID=MMETSP1346-20131115/10590_1 /ASSEMBLY_ACC=CAM_ASM_000771 /TAXON_ID=215587 /ORGANISM="Aplanochytrium stocchinoi, Strain GSBS06" /LENGTH=121 /DNA_ID=CAMNT_0051962421 /DNA_START=92 /DNA_END=457 /DNA_ORIENTATION=-
MSKSAVDTEATIERIQQKEGVTGFLICGTETTDEDGEKHYEIHRSGASMPKDIAQQYADKFCKLTILANEITRDLDPKNELLVFRVKANKQEILVAPKYEPDGTPKFHIVAVQSLNSGSAM